MPKHKLTEIDEILAKSRRLTTHFGETDLFPRNVFRGVAELNEASRQLSQSSSSSRVQPNFSDAYLLLSQKNFDAKKLRDDVNAIKLKADAKEDTLSAAFDMEKSLEKIQSRIQRQIAATTDRLNAENLDHLRKDWRAAEWEKEKKDLVTKMSHQLGKWEGNYGYAAPAITDASPNVYAGMPPTTPAKSSNNSNNNNINNSLLMTPASPFNLSSLMSRPAPANFTTTPVAAPHHYAMTPGTTTVKDSLQKLHNRPLHSQLLQAHTAVIRNLQLYAHSRTTQGTPVFPCRELSNSINVSPHIPAKTVISDGMTKSDLTTYKSLLDFLADIVGEKTNGDAITPGFYSSICFESGEVYDDIQALRRKALTIGARQYLESQIAEIWSRAVDTAVYNGELTVLVSNEGTSKQQRLRSYVSYQFRIGAIPQQCGKVLCPFGSRAVHIQNSQGSQFNVTSTPLWAYVYHCLRIGDLTAAASELSKCTSAGYREGESHAATAVRLLAQISIKEPSDAELQTLIEAMAQCTALYGADVANEEEGNVDPYRVMVLNLLGLSDKEGLATCPIPGFSLEDFMWSQLWFVHMSRLVSEYSLQGAGTINSALTTSEFGFKPSNRAGEIDFFDLILEYGGADYFDQDRASPFKYATVLFSCQRFGDAIAHLWATGKTVPAVHLTVICLYYGLILPHQPLTENPRSVSMTSTPDETTPSYVLQVFLNTNIFLYYPENVVDYLISLNTNWLTFAVGLEDELRELHKLKSQGAVTCILELFVVSLDKDCLNVIVGAPVDSTTSNRQHVVSGAARTTGRLDDYLESSQVDMILCRTAYHKLAERKEPESAIYLYQLAGRYADVLNEMCDQLSTLLIPSSMSYVTQAVNGSTLKDSIQHQQVNNAQKAAREHWRSLAKNFVEKNLQSGLIHIQLTQSGHTELATIVVVLLNLFDAVDAYCNNDYERCLALLDEQQLLPVLENQIDVLMQAATQPHIVNALDDLLIIAMECTKMLYQHTKATRMTLASTPYKQSQQSSNFGLLGDKDVRMQALLVRARALVTFAGKLKSKLHRAETVNVLGRLEASFV